MIAKTFDASLVDSYTKAFLEDRWFDVGHFSFDSSPMVWLENGDNSGYVSISEVNLWELNA